jgi:hypothetical protein
MALVLGLGLGACTYETAPEESDDNNMGIRGWSQAGLLRTNDPSKTVSCQAHFPERGNYTVQFNIDQRRLVDALANPFRTAAKAVVSWTVNGITTRRVINVSDGSSITGAADTAHVVLFDATNEIVTPAIDYSGLITISKGTRGSSKQPPYLVPNGVTEGQNVSVAAGAFSAVFPIPEDAGINSVFVTAVSATGALITNGQAFVTFTNGSRQTVYDPRDYDWVPIDPGVDTFQYGVVGGAAGPVQFSIFFGVDG